MTNINQKALTYSQDSLTRRPVESNHILRCRTVRVSDDGQTQLTSASHGLRAFYCTPDRNKNNLSIAEEEVFDPIPADAASSETHILSIATAQNMSSSAKNPFV